ncbi:MAG: rhodanese-like domain-containing protein [Verrucomicrobiales bacterium]|nr:rhodanese-like domain-containing protein [Verrucomicrobiales bacterium]
MKHGWTRVVRDALAVAATGLAVAVVANAISPRGLSWTRDYFPALTVPTTTPAAAPAPGESALPRTTAGASSSVAVAVTPASTVVTASTTNPTSPGRAVEAGSVADRLKQRGLAVVSFEEVVRYFEDPRREQERILFVDARKDERYSEGHIPGAYPLDHYYPDRYLPELLPACQLAEVIIVYCTGGACEDSEFAALLLKEAGVAADRLRVFLGGMEEWRARGRLMEVGARQSGELKGGGSP